MSKLRKTHSQKASRTGQYFWQIMCQGVNIYGAAPNETVDDLKNVIAKRDLSRYEPAHELVLCVANIRGRPLVPPLLFALLVLGVIFTLALMGVEPGLSFERLVGMVSFHFGLARFRR